MTLQSRRSPPSLPEPGPVSGDPGLPAVPTDRWPSTSVSWRLGLRFLRDAAALGALVAGIAAFVLVAAGAVAVRLGPSRPDAAGWLVTIVALAGTSATIAVPLGVAAGPALALEAWKSGGAWDAARIAGLRGGFLAVPAAILGTAALALWPVEHRIVPECRAYLETAPLGRWTLVPGRALATPAGDAVGLADGFLIVAEGSILRADRAEAVRRDGPAVRLTGVRARGRDGVTWSADAVIVPVGGPGSLGARTDAELRSASPYGRMILAKRTVHPVTSAVLGAALLPLGASRRPWLGIGLCALGLLVAIRLGDAASGALGSAAAGFEPAFVLVVAVIGWARWRDR